MRINLEKINKDKYNIEEKELTRVLSYIKRLENRMNRAINYIENEDIDICMIRNNDIQDTKQELLDILKGEDK